MYTRDKSGLTMRTWDTRGFPDREQAWRRWGASTVQQQQCQGSSKRSNQGQSWRTPPRCGRSNNRRQQLGQNISFLRYAFTQCDQSNLDWQRVRVSRLKVAKRRREAVRRSKNSEGHFSASAGQNNLKRYQKCRLDGVRATFWMGELV